MPLDVGVMESPMLSMQVAPASLYVLPRVIVTGLEPSRVMTGFVGSDAATTSTVLDTGVARLPASSVQV